ncbi:hypothetical protein AM588_10011015 [Phytophthora nicotianae]|uniref:Uncharacterized protein n=1 Tax=Phytophthora nicotianae TaxID=4792 RepID=A0A0W8DLA6_PHYNI|nr:hypothetical protein AM588_10011015 [Phytophthora nicotianae]
MMHGKGVFTTAGGSLHGTWTSGELNGQGVHRFQCGSVYTGEYKAGERHGIGTLTFASGEVYEGEWHTGEMQGYGSWSSPDGRKYIGTWVHGFPSGRVFSVGNTMKKTRKTATGTSSSLNRGLRMKLECSSEENLQLAVSTISSAD